MKIGTISILIFMFPFLGHGQNVVEEVQRLLDNYNEHVQPEYVEITVDKGLYFTGERLWYSLYISDAAYRQTQASAVAYVEIRDGRDTILIRQKIAAKKGLANGDIAIPKSWPSGSYRLVAYTLWMRNSGRITFSEKRINILNPDYPIQPSLNKKNSEGKLRIQQLTDKEFRIDVESEYNGVLTAMTREEVFFRKPVKAGVSYTLNCERSESHHVYIILIDSGGRIAESREIQVANAMSNLRVQIDHPVVSPRERIDVAIEVRDKAGNLLPAVFTVSARQASRLDPSVIQGGEIVQQLLATKGDREMQFRKESIIYPRTRGTLPAITYRASTDIVPFESTTEADEGLIQATMRRKIMRNFGIEPNYSLNSGYNIPFNISFRPSDYAGISTLEDFFREAVPVVKVRKQKDQKTLFVRNSDNPSMIYFFKQPPLMLVDGFVVNGEQLFSTPIHDVERLNITWGATELNSMNIFSMTDYGIVSIITKSNYPVQGATTELFKDFHTPAIFSQGKDIQDNAHLPRLADPVYWEPNIQSKGRTKISFIANDEPGKIAVLVTGFTETGDFFSTEGIVTVKSPD